MSELKAELRRFGETTSIRGVSKFFKTQNKFLKALWLLCVLCCTCGLAVLLYYAFDRYYGWPIMTKYGESENDITFPDITICNLDTSAAGSSDKLSMKDYFAFLDENKKNISAYLKNQINLITEDDEIFNYFNSLAGYIFNLPKNRPKSVDCPNLIADCRVFTTDWSERDNNCLDKFIERWNVNHYTCSTLKVKELTLNDNFTRKVIRGIAILLNVGPPNEIQIPFSLSLTSSQARGVQISVHSQNTPPDLKRGFSAGPGTENIVTIVQTDRTREDKPYDKNGCTDEKKLSSSSEEVYTRDSCVEYCLQKIVFSELGCMSHIINIPPNYDDVKICGNFSLYEDKKIWSNFSYVENVLKVFVASLEIMRENTDDCEMKCLTPCKESIYNSYLASSTWPQTSLLLSIFENYILDRGCMNYESVKQRYADYYRNYMVENNITNTVFLGKNNLPPIVPLSSLDQIRESFLVVKLMIKENVPFYETDQPAYTVDTMIGVVGGMFSLWLGITVSTAVEFIELVYLLCESYFKKKKQVQQDSSKSITMKEIKF